MDGQQVEFTVLVPDRAFQTITSQDLLWWMDRMGHALDRCWRQEPGTVDWCTYSPEHFAMMADGEFVRRQDHHNGTVEYRGRLPLPAGGEVVAMLRALADEQVAEYRTLVDA